MNIETNMFMSPEFRSAGLCLLQRLNVSHAPIYSPISNIALSLSQATAVATKASSVARSLKLSNIDPG